jgi:hypothetical protein
VLVSHVRVVATAPFFVWFSIGPAVDLVVIGMSSF